MNKLIYILSIISLGLFSCSDLLDKEPLDSISEEIAFEEIGDFDAALIGVYDAMAEGFSGYAHFLNLEIPTAFSDNVVITSNGEFGFSSKNLYDGALAPIESVWQSSIVWKNYYTAIVRTNLIIRAIDNFKKGSELERNNLKGEALALRGILHFDLVRLFAQDYSTDPNALGVPYMKELTQEYVSRNTIKEVYDWAIKDLEDASLILDDEHYSYRISKSAIQAFLTRIYLTKKDYANCIAAADKFIALSKNHIAEASEYKDMWNDADYNKNGEVVFRIRYIEGDGKNPNNGGVFYNPFSGYLFYPSSDLFALYDQGSDIRFTNFFIEDATNPGNFGINKYPGRSELASPYYPVKTNDVKVIRASEVYLNKAEAMLENGAIDTDIIGVVNEIRSRRITGFVNPAETGAAVRTTVLNERRKELAFEGIRFYDLKRQNKAIMRGAVEFMKANDAKFAFPLPYEEVNRNPNLVQNKY